MKGSAQKSRAAAFRGKLIERGIAMQDFVELATKTIKDFASTISTAATSEAIKKAYLLGVDHACELLKEFAQESQKGNKKDNL